MIDWGLTAIVGKLGAKALDIAFRRGDIQVCQTREMRGGRGLPWNRKILVHPREDEIEIKWADGPPDPATIEPVPGQILGIRFPPPPRPKP